jgi:O-antigen ligase
MVDQVRRAARYLGGGRLLVALLPLTALVSITEGSNGTASHSLWEPVSLVLLFTSYGVFATPRPRQAWLWLLSFSALGMVVSAVAAGSSLTAVAGPLMSVASMVSTIYYLRALALRGGPHLWIACSALGVALLGYTLLVLRGTDEYATNPWKFGLGYAVTIIVLSVCALTRSIRLELCAALALAAVSLAAASRSLGSTILLAVLVLAMSYVARDQPPLSRFVARLSIIGVVAVCGSLLADLVSSSEIFASSRDRFLEQAAVNANPLFAGRTEPPMSIAAISESPILGWGPHPEATYAIVDRAAAIAQSLGYSHVDDLVPWWAQEGGIYTHSVVADVWVRGGVLAALLFVAAMLALVLFLGRAVVGGQKHTTLALFMAAQSVWDILFSPPSYPQLTLIGFAIGLASISRVATDPAEEPAVRGEFSKHWT